MALKEYNKKRNFLNTSEPQGKEKKSRSKKLKFVIQHHKARADHYDFRLQHNGVLISWAVPKGLSMNPEDKRLAVHVEDHPLDYADFEGIIPKGNYGAGTVEIFDRGYYFAEDDFEKGLKKGHIKIILDGKKYKGSWSLVKMDDKNWLIIKSDDSFANTKSPSSAKIKNPFSSCSPQLATLTDKIPTGKNWIFEIKYDGYRVLSFVENGKTKLISRNGIDYTKKFSQIAKSLKSLVADCFVLDGEIVCFDENGRSDFGLLQTNIKKGNHSFHYVVFDLLALNGQDLREKKLKERKELLEKLLKNCHQNLIYSTHVAGKGKQTFSFAKKHNLEGIIAKNINSAYKESRTEDWLKIKCYKRQEFVIGGFATSDKNEVLSAILVGYYKNQKLIFAGKVGTGFNEQSKTELSKLFKNITSKESPFDDFDSTEKNITFLKPTLIAEIQYAEFTKSNVLRQPSFLGLREDKNPKDVKLEEKIKK